MVLHQETDREEILKKEVAIKEGLRKQALRILEGENLEDKLLDIKDYSYKKEILYKEVKKPGRNGRLSFSHKKYKFPKNFDSKESRARALHSFANHELLAIEIMCYALIKFPNSPELHDFKKDLVDTIKDEQVHLRLYIDKIQELGYEFGDFPLNDFFWKHALEMREAANFSAFMSLTFEMANLDFSYFYMKKFEEIEDTECAEIMHKVFSDEVKHVKYGVKYLDQWRGRDSLWKYYKDNLIFPLTPARSIGICYQSKFRRTVGLDSDFIFNLENFSDGFNITKRKK